ncbi:MAG: cell division protein ZipA C-terminal FtsZ-binding domain-containing protein, partial [Nevskiales bacterium]
MGTTEWVMLAAAVAVVLMIYLITRRNNGPNPWEGMEDDAGDELPAKAPKRQQQAPQQDKPEVIVDPSVAGEWADFTPEAQQTLDEPPRDVDEINPASLRKAPSLEPAPSQVAAKEPNLSAPSEAMLGFVSEPRPVRDAKPRAPVSKQQPPARAEPKLDAAPTKAVSSKPQQATESKASKPPKAANEQKSQKIVVLHVVAQQGTQLAGTQIHAALEQCGLQFGERDVFHRMAEFGGKPQSVFSIANMLKPGTLNPDDAEAL